MSFQVSHWQLTPGPYVMDQPGSSITLQEIAEYPPDRIAERILSFPGVMLLRDANPNWYSWRARWSSHAASIEIDMTIFDIEPIAWGGSWLSGDCSPQDLLNLWLHLRAEFCGVWLHDIRDCGVETPDSFRSAYGLPQ